ncbi:hypothetical protein BDW75DRAFT_37752 [Aspergillus navahoensis]
MRTVSGASSLLLRTTVFPAAKANASLNAKNAMGTFHGIMQSTTPYSCLTVRLKWPGVFKLDVPWTVQPASAKWEKVSAETVASKYRDTGLPVDKASSRANSSLFSRLEQPACEDRRPYRRESGLSTPGMLLWQLRRHCVFFSGLGNCCRVSLDFWANREIRHFCLPPLLQLTLL